MNLLPLLAVPSLLLGASNEPPPPTVDELTALTQPLRSPDATARKAAAEKLSHLPPSGIELYAKRLLAPRPVAAATLRALLLEVWAQVPNPLYPQQGELWARKPEPKWTPPKSLPKGAPRPKRPAPHDPEKTDWLTALEEVDLDGNPALAALPDRVEARAEALEATALVRSLGESGRAEAVTPLWDLAFQLEGVFRDECGRAIRGLGSLAVPELVRRMHNDKLSGKQRRYASYQLDRMDRARPSKAITTAPDDATRAAILHAYGEVRALDAVDAVLAEVDSSSWQVRREARWAWLRYVTGPPPPPAPSRKRKLPGGGTESEAKEDYLNYREMATLAVTAQLTAVRAETNQPPPSPQLSAEQMTRELLGIYDGRRDAEWSALYQSGLRKRDAGDLAGAVGDFSWILAHDPFYGPAPSTAAANGQPPPRAEMARALRSYGEALGAKGEVERARGLLHQSLALWPDGPDAPRIAAELALLEVKQAEQKGRVDEAAFRRALALDPTFAPARRVLDEGAARKASRRRRMATGVALLGVGMLGLLAGVFVLLGRVRTSAA